MFRIVIPAVATLCLCTSAFAEWGTPAPVIAMAPAKSAPAAANPLKDIDALRKAVTDAWQTMPLAVQHAMFVTEKAQITGAWSERPSNVFKPGEKLLTYVEPVGYTWKPRGDMFDFGVSTDVVVKSVDGKVVGGQEGFSKVTLSSHTKLHEFMLNLTMSVDGIPPGQYVLEYKLHDLGSDKVATFAQPFTISE
jgi:hypothetical protein